MSPRHFTIDQNFFTLRLPENCSPLVINDVTSRLEAKLAEAVNAGLSRALIDVHEVKGLNMTIIKLLLQTMQMCHELAMQFALVGNANVITECKGFEDTRSWSFFESMVEARESLLVKKLPIC